MRSSLLLALCVLACGLGAANAATCGIEGLDFSSLTGKDYTGSDGGASYAYYMNLCGPLTSPAAASCVQIDATSSACQKEVVGGDNTYDIGNYPTTAPPSWIWLDAAKSGAMMTLTGAPQCWATGQVQPYSTSIILKCSQTQDTSFTVQAPPQASCLKNFTMNTPLACTSGGGGGGGGGGGSGGKHGLSGGWVFIIILCVVIPVYVVGGCLYKSQKLGATGIDKCPNVEFWRDLPSLVKDGCRFFYNKLRGLCGGGSAAGNTGSYETM